MSYQIHVGILHIESYLALIYGNRVKASSVAKAYIPPKPMMHIAFYPYFKFFYKFHPPISAKFIHFPNISANVPFLA